MGLDYKADPNDSTKQIPNNAVVYNRAVTPAANTEVARASYVVINVGHATKYEFKYTASGDWYDYGVVPIASNAGAGPVKLDIQPIAWKGGGASTGDVTFVYTVTDN
jgi:hypothetical protein